MPPVLKSLFIYLSDALFPKRKAMAELRARWGQPGDKDGWLASDYFDLVREREPGACIDDKTWGDLEYPRIFASMDSTVTPVGSQVLFQRLHACVGDADELATRCASYSKLQSNAGLREVLQRKLLPLKDEHNARIAHFIFGALPPPLKHQRLLHAWALLSVAVLVVVLAMAWPIWIWLAMVAVNAVVIFGTGDRAMRDVETLRACLYLVKVANDLAALPDPGASLPQLAGLRAEAGNRAAVRNSLRPLSWLKLPGISLLATWLNFAFLVELLAHVRAMRQFATLRNKLAASFALVGEIDAMIAIASWLECCPRHCPARLADRAVLEIEDGCHPLLIDGVANSIRLDRRSALVTGSNMAGKTTFIKMVAVNALLGQTLGFCLAAGATIPRSSVMASIQAGHSVASGKSHYFSEVETIQSFLARQARGGCTIFVIDELFSGTNTIERVAVARAVLETLGAGSIVLATTHDVELQALLDERYELYHFQESPKVDGFFDYRLRSGPATQRNAIRLLGELGFPDRIIAKAMAYADQESRAEAQDAVCDAATKFQRSRFGPLEGRAIGQGCAAGAVRITLPAFAHASPSMPRQAIHSDSAPAAIGPYSQAVRSGNTLYLSGQTPLDPATGEMVAGGIDQQAERVFENLKAVLAAADAKFDDVVRVAIYMTDLGNFAAVNEVMKRYFNEPYPARSTIGVAALPRGAAVEVDVIAVSGASA